MKHTIKFLIVFLISINVFSQNSESESVLKSFEKYKNAVLNDKGKIAADYVDSRTMKYYSDVLEKVKTADSTEVSAMGIIEKLTVLSIRHRASKKEIISFNGRSFFEYAITSGIVGKNSVMKSTLGEINTNGNFATAELFINERKTPFYFHFYKEDNIWKMDITNLFSLAVFTLNKTIADSGKSENDFILNILEVMNGKKPTDEIWKPII